MIALKIPNIKNFMNKLLVTETFDDFLLVEASITTFSSFFIDGHIQKDFFDNPPSENEFIAFDRIRPIAFDLMKGKRTPLQFKFVFHVSPERCTSILDSQDSLSYRQEMKSLVLTVKYDGHELTCITATAFHTFVPDKTMDTLWDQSLKTFFTEELIEFETLV